MERIVTRGESEIGLNRKPQKTENPTPFQEFRKDEDCLICELGPDFEREKANNEQVKDNKKWRLVAQVNIGSSFPYLWLTWSFLAERTAELPNCYPIHELMLDDFKSYLSFYWLRNLLCSPDDFLVTQTINVSGSHSIIFGTIEIT